MDQGTIASTGRPLFLLFTTYRGEGKEHLGEMVGHHILLSRFPHSSSCLFLSFFVTLTFPSLSLTISLSYQRPHGPLPDPPI